MIETIKKIEHNHSNRVAVSKINVIQMKKRTGAWITPANSCSYKDNTGVGEYLLPCTTPISSKRLSM
jgi:hypothetical protein